MVAIRLTPELFCPVVGSPTHLKKARRLATPEELTQHETIRYRFLTSGMLHRWQFMHCNQRFSVETKGGPVVNDTTSIAEFVRAGLGLAYLPDVEVAEDAVAGRLERVLQSFIPRTTGLYLYFSLRTQQQPKLRAFVDMVAKLSESLQSGA